MKKGKILLASLLTASLLASCDFKFPWSKDKEDGNIKEKNWPVKIDVSGGSAEEQEAIRAAVNGSIAIKSGTTSVTPLSTIILSEDSGDYMKLEKTKVSKGHTVTLEWAVDTTSEYYKDFVDNGENSKFLYIKYKGYDYKSETGSISFTLKKATCGEAKAENANLVYNCSVKNTQIYIAPLKIAEAIAVTDQQKVVDVKGTDYVYPSTFDMVDYEYHSDKKYSPYFIVDPRNVGIEGVKEYYYCEVPGKVIYLAPDGNWGLIADGNYVLEIYAGAGTALTTANYPYLAVGNYVKVKGNLSQYCGNIQLGFITSITELTNHSEIEEPSGAYATLDETKLAALNLDAPFTCQKQAVEGFSNSLAKVTGVIDPTTIKDRDGKSVSASAVVNNRFTFELRVGSEKIVVAYDYHCDKDGSHGLFNTMKSKLQAGGTLTVEGTMRYNGSDSSPFILSGNTGVWNIVPLTSANIK